MTSDGNLTGRNLFNRGHIYDILTNPLYAGCTRRRDKVHDGQHLPIIDPERWDRIEEQLQEGAARQRGKVSAKRRSLLCGNLRSTPSSGEKLSCSRTASTMTEREV